MKYECVLPPAMARDLKAHLLGDRSREQMAILLAGVHRLPGRTRLLGRRLIAVPPEGFSHQSETGLALDQELQRRVLQLAAKEGLSQIDFHTHPGDGPGVDFSSIDDGSEVELARYLARRLPTTLYGSVVMNGCSTATRLWRTENGRPTTVPLALTGLGEDLVSCVSEAPGGLSLDRFDRQVRAFGMEFQRRLAALTIGVVGLGGIGSVVTEELARLGVRRWVLVDPDRIEASNLNRVVGATPRDAEEEQPKVTIAARSIRRIDPGSEVAAIFASASAPRAVKALKRADLIVAATDNEASRLLVNSLGCQYLISIVHVGVNLDAEGGLLRDVSGEFAIPEFGAWCLLCAGLINSQRASWELAPPEERRLLAERGYLSDTPAPSVYHLNATVASLAVAEIHNLVRAYKRTRRYVVYRELETELMAVTVPPQHDCLHCGSQGLLGLGDLRPLPVPRPAGVSTRLSGAGLNTNDSAMEAERIGGES